MINVDMIATNYQGFRHMVNTASQHIENQGNNTLLYNHQNQVIAMMQAGSIDRAGRAHPAQYFVREPSQLRQRLAA